MRDLAQLFKALADETRLQLLALLLREGELCVCDCEQALGISQSKTSRHLRTLSHAGLVTDRREGLWVHYRIASSLDSDRRRVLETVDALLGPERVDEIRDGLRQWRARKAVEGPGAPPRCCGGDR